MGELWPNAGTLCDSRGWIKNPENPTGWFACRGCERCRASGAAKQIKIAMVAEDGTKRPVDVPGDHNGGVIEEPPPPEVADAPARRAPLAPLVRRAPLLVETGRTSYTDAPLANEPRHDAAPPPEPPRARAAAKRGGKSRGNDYYMTDPKIIEAAKKLGPIELDPCGACRPVYDEEANIVEHLPVALSPVGAEREYLLSRNEDGLALPWRTRIGVLWFCNPPYSQTRKWVEKADDEYKRLASGLLLIAARTGTIAFQAARAPFICFVGERLMFLDPETGSPPVDAKGKPTGAMFDSAVLYYGARESAFRAVFEPLGKVVRWHQ